MTQDRSAGGRLVAVDGRELPLRSAGLKVEAAAGLARVVLEQRFHNPYSEPLELSYSLPLPQDAAVSGFAFRLGERRVVGEVETREQAREDYEQALLEGRSAALLEQERGSLFTQRLGNLPPGEDVYVELTLDQRLVWRPDGEWEWRFPTVVAPRYQGAEGRVPDTKRLEQDVNANADARVSLALELAVGDRLASGSTPLSPSHPIAARGEGDDWQITLDDTTQAGLDRDVVMRWAVAETEPGVSLELARPAKQHARHRELHGLLTVVPPRIDTRPETLSRDLIVLLDTSGSMHGQPLDRACQLVAKLIDSLSERDSLELIAFGSEPVRWRTEPCRMGASDRKAARDWVGQLRAGGATEMVEAAVEALAPLRGDALRQVVLVTDGLIGFEDELLRTLRERLPALSRFHTVGIGSAVNRSLTAAAARLGRGVELILDLDEDVAETSRALRARLEQPVVVDLEIAGSALVETAPRALPDLYAGAPVLVGLRLGPKGGTLSIHGRSSDGAWQQELQVARTDAGSGNPAVSTLYAREAVEDLETDRRRGKTVDRQIEKLGLDFQIATRLTSWVAISEEPSVDPGEPLRRVRQPQQLPHGMSAEGLGLREAAGMGQVLACASALDRDAFLDARTFGSRFRREAMAPSPAPAVELHGSLVSWDGKQAVLTIEVDLDELDWQPSQARLTLVWSDGSRRRAYMPWRLLRQGTTRAALLRHGQSLRIVCSVRGKQLSERPERLTLELFGASYDVSLSGD